MHSESFWPLCFYRGQFDPYTLNLGQFNQILTVRWMVPLNIHVWWHVGCYVRWHVNKLTRGIFMMTWQVKKITKLHEKKTKFVSLISLHRSTPFLFHNTKKKPKSHLQKPTQRQSRWSLKPPPSNQLMFSFPLNWTSTFLKP